MMSTEEQSIEVDPDDAKKIKREDGPTPRRYKQKFRKLWLQDPAFSDWLEETDVPSKAFCSVCNTEVAAKMFDLRKHSETKKHIKKLHGVEVPRVRQQQQMHGTSQMESIVVNFPEVNRTTPVNHILHSRLATDTLRLWQCCGTEILPHNLMLPFFVTDNADAVQPIASLPGVFRYGINKLCDYLLPLINDGLTSVLLHGVPTKMTKDNVGTAANASNNPVILAVKKIREVFPTLTVACDVCLCPYTNHGHCGVLTPEGIIDNEATVKRLSELALSYAFAGTNILAPSDMMDGRVAAIKMALQQAGFANRVSVLSHSAKFASNLYAEFKEINTSLSDISEEFSGFGNRNCYQLPTGSIGMAMQAVARDVDEGADMLIVKPAMPYLDVVRQIKDKYPTHPVFVYQVSGEYGMLHHASSSDAFDLQSALQEILISMRRAGADVIITYFTPMILQWLKHQF